LVPLDFFLLQLKVGIDGVQVHVDDEVISHLKQSRAAAKIKTMNVDMMLPKKEDLEQG